MAIEVVGALAGLLLLTFDLAATWRIWTTPQLERPQRIVQTILIWLVPGAFVAVRYLLNPPREPYSDPTVAKIEGGSMPGE
jgi:hypothetical protein